MLTSTALNLSTLELASGRQARTLAAEDDWGSGELLVRVSPRRLFLEDFRYLEQCSNHLSALLLKVSYGKPLV